MRHVVANGEAMNKKKKSQEVVRDSSGRAFRPVVLQVVGRDDDGTPRLFRLLRDDEEINLEETPPEHRAFEIVYAREGVLLRHN